MGQPSRGSPHFPDRTGRPGRGAPHFPDGAAGQRHSTLPRWGNWAEALLTSQMGRPGRGAPHFPDDGWLGRVSPHLPDGAARQRCSSFHRWGSQAEALLTSQMMGGQAEALLTSQTGRPGTGARHFLPDGVAAGQRCSTPPRWGGWAEVLLTSQMRWPGTGVPHLPDGVAKMGSQMSLCRFSKKGVSNLRNQKVSMSPKCPIAHSPKTVFPTC
ncbi:uncharacterized protein LOC129042065 [Pongo pygmaeus]|uniref:uncharacterized protein LOC129042065 n=1 Tax=Pongo pygmaeus TaxID=9600 RepID=UPI0023E1D6B9|nr:uncharacterized protein LOC129042065 [Pongo pygmaeus]